MSIAIGCLLAAAAMIYLTKLPLAIAQARSGGYDNNYPRAQQARLEGFGQRALSAHQNAIEAFPVFAAGLLAALWAHADIETVNRLALLFVVARVGFSICYWLNWDKLRSIIWGVGMVCSLWLMALALPV